MTKRKNTIAVRLVPTAPRTKPSSTDLSTNDGHARIGATYYPPERGCRHSYSTGDGWVRCVFCGSLA